MHPEEHIWPVICTVSGNRRQSLTQHHLWESSRRWTESNCASCFTPYERLPSGSVQWQATPPRHQTQTRVCHNLIWEWLWWRRVYRGDEVQKECEHKKTNVKQVIRPKQLLHKTTNIKIAVDRREQKANRCENHPAALWMWSSYTGWL